MPVVNRPLTGRPKDRMPSRSFSALCALLLIVPAGVSEAREFTNKKGQTMVADVVGVAGEKVFFEKAKGKRFSYAMDQLSEADQAYVKQWSAKNVKAELAVTKCQSVSMGRRRVGNDEVKKTIETRAYKVTVKNEGDLPVSGVVCCYSLFTKLNDRYADANVGRIRILDPRHGKFDLPLIAPGAEETFTTKSVVVGRHNSSQLRGSIRYVSKYSIRLAGGNFHFYSGDRLVGHHNVGGFKDEGAPKPSHFEEETDEEEGADDDKGKSEDDDKGKSEDDDETDDDKDAN